jgi:hypothetical protein
VWHLLEMNGQRHDSAAVPSGREPTLGDWMSRGVGLGTIADKLTPVIWPVGSMNRAPMHITIVSEYDAVFIILIIWLCILLRVY